MESDPTRCLLDSRHKASHSRYNKHIAQGIKPDRHCQLAQARWMVVYRKRKARGVLPPSE